MGKARQIGRLPLARIASSMNAAYAKYTHGDLNGALAVCLNDVLSTQSDHADALNLVGCILIVRKEHARALTFLERAVAAGPTADTWHNIGLAYVALGRRAEGERAYRQAVAVKPSNSRSWNNLGNIAFARHDDDAAETCYRNALANEPRYATAHVNLARVLNRRGNDDAAEMHFLEALRLDPGARDALAGLSELAEEKRDFEQALNWTEQALSLHPADAATLARALHLGAEMAKWDAFDATLDRLRVLLKRAPAPVVTPLPLLCLPHITPREHRAAARAFANARWAQQLSAPPLVWLGAVRKETNRRPRFGYLSPDFRNHPVAHLITDVIEAHDPERFEIVLYGYGPASNDAERKRLTRAAHRFADIGHLDDRAAAERIEHDDIDLLIDLAGYTTHGRPGIAALRPAPVIASWLGYIGTLGEPRLADYVIGDQYATPPGAEDDFSEMIARMPYCFQPNPPPEVFDAVGRANREEEGLPADAFVFCSFNQEIKLNPDLWDDWCHILTEVPGAVLWLAPPRDRAGRERLRKEAGRRGVAPERLVFCTRKPLAEHRRRIALADLALDTFPYNSGTTASDALGMGVPLLTRSGESFVSRMAGSLLTTLGLPELITSDRDGYRQRAIALAHDSTALLALRERLRLNRTSSPLFQPQRFCRDLEALYLRMLARDI
jgi:protein O-GlcNAc transferase